jgi:hypothetical protein
MTDRAATLSGAFSKVTLGATSKILGAGTFEISGGERRTVDVSEFGVDVDIYDFGSADGGTITLSNVAIDITDPQQTTWRTNMESKIKFIFSATSGIRFWANSTSYWTIGTSGSILPTRAGAVSQDRNGVARTTLEGKVSGEFMYLI